MRKEIIGICLFFLVIFTLISLVSYNPADPSILHAAKGSSIHNLFGKFGAYVSGMFIGLFGIGAFWVPVLLLIFSIHFLGQHTPKAFALTFAGGILLIISTGSLLSFIDHQLNIMGIAFPSGGLIGTSFSDLLLRYTNAVGGTIILVVILLIGLISSTGFSVVNFYKRAKGIVLYLSDRVMTIIIKYKEQKKKATRFQKVIEKQKNRKKN